MSALITVLAQSKSQGGGLVSLLPLLLIGGVVFYMAIVPQRKQRQKHATFVAGLDVDDEVVTSGGVYGRITYLEDGVVHLEVDTDVVIRVSTASIARSAVTSAEPAKAPTRGRRLKGEPVDEPGADDGPEPEADPDAADTAR